MPPAGERANLAMYDGADLGNALGTHPDDTEAALLADGEAMFPRSAASDALVLLERQLGVTVQAR